MYKTYTKDLLQNLASFIKQQCNNNPPIPLTFDNILSLVKGEKCYNNGTVAFQPTFLDFDYVYIHDPIKYHLYIGKRYTEVSCSDGTYIPSYFFYVTNSICHNDRSIIMRQERILLNGSLRDSYKIGYFDETHPLYVYVPRSLAEEYSDLLTISDYPNQVINRIVEEYTTDGTLLGPMDEKKMGITT